MSSTPIRFRFYARSQAHNGNWQYIAVSGTAEPPEAARESDSDDDEGDDDHREDLPPDNIGTISIPCDLVGNAAVLRVCACADCP